MTAEEREELARLREALAVSEARNEALRVDNQRLRWRHPTVVPAWDDLPDEMRTRLSNLGRSYSDEAWGGDMALAFWTEFRARAMRDPADCGVLAKKEAHPSG